jgi:hypothetical protein
MLFMLCHIGNGKGYIRLQNVNNEDVGTKLNLYLLAVKRDKRTEV